jgi:hypothetical protein
LQIRRKHLFAALVLALTAVPARAQLSPAEQVASARMAWLSGPVEQVPASDEEIWSNLVDQHRAYVDKFGLWFKQPNLWGYFPLHFYADGGFLMLHSYFSHNPTFTVAGPADPTIPTRSFDYGVNFAPRVALGAIVPNGFGVRAAWWQLDEASATPAFASQDATLHTKVSSVPVFGVPGFTAPSPLAQKFDIFKDMLQFENHLQLTVWDTDIFRQFSGERWALLAGGGVRYLYLSEHYTAFRFNSGKVNVGSTTFKLNQDADTVDSGRNFAGLGPTCFLEGRRLLGRTGFSFYANARASALFGRNDTGSFQTSVANLQTVPAKGPTTSTAVTTTQALATADRTLQVTDFELGVDYTLAYGRTLLFARMGLADQTIFGSGSATSGNGVTGFFGLRLSAGFNY